MPERYTNSVCSVKGTDATGIRIRPESPVRAAKSAAPVRSRLFVAMGIPISRCGTPMPRRFHSPRTQQMAITFAMSSAVQPLDRSMAGFFNPWISGPSAIALASR
jgi:hypothetical protein